MPTVTRDAVVKPGLFGHGVAADTRRVEFDYRNESLLVTGVRPDVLFIGDSITHLWEVQAYFSSDGRILVNRGIGGDDSTHVRRRFEADALQLRPRLIVLHIGTNDLGWELAQLNEALTETVGKNILAMVYAARGAAIPIAVCALLPIWGPSWNAEPDFAPRKNAQIVEINTRLAAMAAETGAIYVDYHRHMRGAGGALRHELADDGVHPHSAGYSIMAYVLRETLAARGIAI